MPYFILTYFILIELLLMIANNVRLVNEVAEYKHISFEASTIFPVGPADSLAR